MVLGTLLDTLSSVGAIGGILAIVGVGLLILLLASQSRELKAMREWIEAEPERQREAQQQTIAEVQRRIAAARERRAAKQGGKPAPPAAKPPAPGAAPPAPGATPAPIPVAAGAAGIAAASGGAVAPPVPAGKAGDAAPASGAPGAPVDPAAGGKPAFSPLSPAGGAASASASALADDDDEHDLDAPEQSGQSTQLADPLPYASSRRETRYDERDFDLVEEEEHHGGNRGLFAAGIAILIAGIVLLGVLLFGGGGDDTPAASKADEATAPAASDAPKSGSGSGSGSAAVDPASVTVRVLNGTTVTGLAQDITDQLSAKGYGSVAPDTYSSNQSLAETTVAYRDGQKSAATQVAKDLGLSSEAVQPMDADIRVAATEQADVAVLVGTDLDKGTSPAAG